MSEISGISEEEEVEVEDRDREVRASSSIDIYSSLPSAVSTSMKGF